MKQATAHHYPLHFASGDDTVECRPLEATDREALTALIDTLPVHDLLFVRRDISHPKVITAWLDGLGERVTSLALFASDEMIGSSALFVDRLSWSAHVGDLRILLRPDWRGRGFGRLLVTENLALAVAAGLEKVTVQMTLDQSAAIALFEELGFQPESVLRKHVKDRDGVAHDLALLSLDVGQLRLRTQARGMADALKV